MKNLIKAQLYVLFLMLFSNGVFATALVVEKISVSPAGNIVRNPDANSTKTIAFQFSQSGVTISNPAFGAAFGADFNAGGSCNIALYNGSGFLAQYVAMRFSANATRLTEIEFYEKTSSGTTQKIPATQITVGGADGRVITQVDENNSPNKAILADGITNRALRGSQYAANENTTVWFDLGSPRVLDRLVVYPGFYDSNFYNPTFYLGDSSDIGPENHGASVLYKSVAINTGRAQGTVGFESNATPNVPFAIKSIGHCDYLVPSGVSTRTDVSSFRPNFYYNTTYIKGPGSDPFTNTLKAGDSIIAATPDIAVSGFTLPSIQVTSPNTKPALSKIVKATDNINPPNTSTWAYKLIDGSATCDAAAMNSLNYRYIEGDNLSFNAENINGQKVCFSSTSNRATSYKASAVIGGIDRTAPTATISVSPTSTLKSGDTATVTVKFSEAVNDFALGDISVTANTGSLSTLATTDNMTYTATFTPASESTSAATIGVAANVAKDTAGNNNAAAQSKTININTLVVPTITIAKPASGGYISNASIGDGLLIEGTSDALGRTVSITLGSAQAIEVQADATTGAWQATLPASYFTDLAAGSVTLRVQVTNAIGNTAKVELALTKQAASSQTIAATTDETYANQRYSVSAGLVTDKATELMWQQCSLGQTLVNNTCQGVAHHYTWADALKAAQDNTDGGHSDWRLPNRNELFSLVAKDRYNPSINLVMYPNTVEIAYWTSSPASQENTKSWVVDFSSGQARTAARTYTYPVRLVRGN